MMELKRFKAVGGNELPGGAGRGSGANRGGIWSV